MKYFSTIYRISALLFIFGATLAISSLLYVTFLERPYLYYPHLPFKVIGKDFHAGDVVPIIVNRCNRDKVTHSYIVSHSLRNVATNNFILLPPTYVSLEPGCASPVGRLNRLPGDLPLGEYEIIGGASPHGTLRTFELTWGSEIFKVIK